MRSDTTRSQVDRLAWPLSISIGTTVLGGSVGFGIAVSGVPLGPSDPPAPEQLSTTLGFWTLLGTNAGVLGLLVAGGLLAGVPTLVILFQNGLVLGLLAGAAAELGVELQYLLLVLPHGVFELPAFWLAGTVGIDAPMEGLRYLRDGSATLDSRRVWRWGRLLAIALLLVLMGAAVESTVSARLARTL